MPAHARVGRTGLAVHVQPKSPAPRHAHTLARTCSHTAKAGHFVGLCHLLVNPTMLHQQAIDNGSNVASRRACRHERQAVGDGHMQARACLGAPQAQHSGVRRRKEGTTLVGGHRRAHSPSLRGKRTLASRAVDEGGLRVKSCKWSGDRGGVVLQERGRTHATPTTHNRLPPPPPKPKCVLCDHSTPHRHTRSTHAHTPHQPGSVAGERAAPTHAVTPHCGRVVVCGACALLAGRRAANVAMQRCRLAERSRGVADWPVRWCN